MIYDGKTSNFALPQHIYYLNNTFERDVPAEPGDHAPAPRPAAVPAHFGQVHLRSV